jgi:AraC family transcriptional regulator
VTTTGSSVEKTVEARQPITTGELTIVRERFDGPLDIVGPGKSDHHLQLSLLPFPERSMACYEEFWGPRRFERMGDLFLLPAESRLRTRSQCREQRSLVCSLSPERVREWFDEDLKWTERRLVGSLDIANGDVRHLMHRLLIELQRPGFATEAMLELITSQVCIQLARHFRGIDIAGPTGGLPPWKLRLIDEHLEHDAGAVTISSLAKACNLSARHLSRAFQTSRGQSLGDHIAERRLDLARQMLAAGISVKQTAFAAGFSAPTNFASAFRRATGMTPRLYRERQTAQ